MPGQTLGIRSYFSYLGDDGTTYKVQLDNTLGILGGLAVDDQGVSLPRRFRPRHVWVEAMIGTQKARKRIVCAPNSPLYTSDVPVDIVIDTVTFTSTGRVGEKVSFGMNPPAVP